MIVWLSEPIASTKPAAASEQSEMSNVGVLQELRPTHSGSAKYTGFDDRSFINGNLRFGVDMEEKGALRVRLMSKKVVNMNLERLIRTEGMI